MEFKQYEFTEIAEYITTKINISDINQEQYISTDNMLVNLGGVSLAESLPATDRCNAFKKRDILFSNIRTYFKKVWLAEFDDGCSADVLVIRSKNEEIVLNEYLYLLICSEDFINFTVMSSNGAKMPRGDKNTIKKYVFNIPSIEYQKFCVEQYFNLNKKIQLNTQINQTLEQIAQTIFKSWFIDFDPVYAKAEALANGQTTEQATLAAMAVISGKTSEELHRLQTANPEQYGQLWDIAEAFPSEMREEGVPMGWELSTIEDNYDVIMGQSPKGETYNEDGRGTLFYQGRAEFGWRYPEPRLYTTDPKRMAKKGNILMSVRAPVGDLNVALEDCCIGRGLAALNHKSNSFSFGLYQMQNLKKEFDVFNGEGTVFGSINQKDLKAIKVIKPSDEVIRLFDGICKFNDLQIENLSKEILSLKRIRDELLPKLLGGEMQQ